MQYSNPDFASGKSPNQRTIPRIYGRGEEEIPTDQERLNELLDGFCLLDGRARMLVDRSGRYLAGSSGMVEIFTWGTCLHVRGGILQVTQAEDRERLIELLEVRAPEVRTLALPCLKIDGHLVIRATSLAHNAVCMSLQSATEMVEPELADLQEVFHLTKAEAAIAYDLFRGHAPHQIAEDHDNSIHTVRAHIRRCYDKLAVTCREELWRKLNAYRLT